LLLLSSLVHGRREFVCLTHLTRCRVTKIL
jgi:hypothetical protein